MKNVMLWAGAGQIGSHVDEAKSALVQWVEEFAK